MWKGAGALDVVHPLCLPGNLIFRKNISNQAPGPFLSELLLSFLIFKVYLLLLLLLVILLLGMCVVRTCTCYGLCAKIREWLSGFSFSFTLGCRDPTQVLGLMYQVFVPTKPSHHPSSWVNSMSSEPGLWLKIHTKVIMGNKKLMAIQSVNGYSHQLTTSDILTNSLAIYHTLAYGNKG